MLFLKRKIGPVVIQHKHNYNKVNFFDAFRFTFYYRIKVSQNHFGFIQRNYYTINNLLDKSLEEIFNGFTSTVKNEIRRGERENIKFGFIQDQ